MQAGPLGSEGGNGGGGGVVVGKGMTAEGAANANALRQELACLSEEQGEDLHSAKGMSGTG